MVHFTGTVMSETQDTRISCEANGHGEVTIWMSGVKSIDIFAPLVNEIISLDVETAIQFRKQLSKSIGYARREGAKNG